MGVEYNQLGEECELRKASHKRGNLHGLKEQLVAVKFVHGKKGREKESELGAGAAVEGEFWSVTGANWSWKTDEPGCQA
jgi:hypothetical protein